MNSVCDCVIVSGGVFLTRGTLDL